MLTFALILLAIVVIAGIFAPDPDTPKKRRSRAHRHSETRGLPWMDPNYKKRKKREERNSHKFKI